MKKQIMIKRCWMFSDARFKKIFALIGLSFIMLNIAGVGKYAGGGYELKESLTGVSRSIEGEERKISAGVYGVYDEINEPIKAIKSLFEMLPQCYLLIKLQTGKHLYVKGVKKYAEKNALRDIAVVLRTLKIKISVCSVNYEKAADISSFIVNGSGLNGFTKDYKKALLFLILILALPRGAPLSLFIKFKEGKQIYSNLF